MRQSPSFRPTRDASDFHSLSAGIGPLTFVDVSLGYSTTCQGKLQGRLKLPVNVPGFLWLHVRVFGLNVVYCSYQLS